MAESSFVPSQLTKMDQNLTLFLCSVWVTGMLEYHQHLESDTAFVNPNAFIFNSADKTCVPGVVRPFSDEFDQLFAQAKQEEAGEDQDSYS